MFEYTTLLRKQKKGWVRALGVCDFFWRFFLANIQKEKIKARTRRKSRRRRGRRGWRWRNQITK